MSHRNNRAAQTHRRAASGFTLFELIITVAIVAILAAIALPSFREFTTRMTVSDNANDLVGALNVARSEAVKRGRTAAVIANGGDWNAGWQVVVAKETAAGVIQAAPTSPGADEADCTGYFDNAVDSDKTVALCPRYRGALAPNYTLTAKGSGTGASDTAVIFSQTGVLVNATGFDFSVCRPAAQADITQSRRITVEAGGTITSRRDVTDSPAGTCT